MVARNSKNILNTLKTKGFKVDNRDHHYLFFYVNDKKTHIRTKISHGQMDYGPYLLGQIAKQLHLSNGQLAKLLDCPLKYEGYKKILVENGSIDIRNNNSD